MILADAMQVTLEMKFGGIKQPKPSTFRVAGTELLYDVSLVQGYASPDYQTAACVFHIGESGYILVQKIGVVLDFYMLDLTGQHESVLDSKHKSPRSLAKGAMRFSVGKIGTKSAQ